MTNRNRIIIAAASLLLLVMYFTPLWSITLEAPQYPEGLGLNIMLDTVEGQNYHDLEKINNLNHYIGMKQIVPESIPELKIMPWAIGLLLILGLLVAARGKRWMLYTWAGLFVVLAVAGLIDFWLWEYDYGHNLDTDMAAIKVPGMTYQPPLIGSKQLLNFTAHSWPGIGGWIAIATCLTGVLVTWDTFRSHRRGAPEADAAPAAREAAPLASAAAVVSIVALAGCGTGPQPFHLGVDQGEYCRMVIDDARFAAQLVTTTGRAYKFDSIECMLSWMDSRPDAAERSEIYVSDYGNPIRLLAAEDALFIRSASISSPMNAGLAAISAAPAPSDSAPALPAAFAAELGEYETLTWRELRAERSTTEHSGNELAGG